ncbi:MAG: calcium/sodium antiporter [Cyclobacteriaceae bacterium]|nr:calcium/sodium antiporter [Cyclobacteriaceae bacterium]MDH4296119.1 calcium/sodium antiporter [Cyclobacteriaceae bacterium]MDH5248999.1 calcium/sodium antiporter [Cyclobacteriaceae bacterium]
MLFTYLLLLVGFAILIKGADFLVTGASSTAKKYGISNLTIGLTVVAFGTSMPELIVSLLAALNGETDASFGNVIGSNNFNLLFIIGIAGIIFPLVVQNNTVKYEIPISMLAAAILFLLVNDQNLWGSERNVLSRLDSIILLLLFAGFIVYVYKTMTRTSDLGQGEKIKIYSIPVSLGLIGLGLAMLIGGGKLVVDNAILVAHHFGLSEKLIGLTILAAGTSLPELATSAVAAYRKNADIAIGNVVGSNIFNIFFILGITGLVRPISYNVLLNFDIYVLLVSTIILIIFMVTLNRQKVDRWEAAILLISYIAYVILLIQMD